MDKWHRQVFAHRERGPQCNIDCILTLCVHLKGVPPTNNMQQLTHSHSKLCVLYLKESTLHRLPSHVLLGPCSMSTKLYMIRNIQDCFLGPNMCCMSVAWVSTSVWTRKRIDFLPIPTFTISPCKEMKCSKVGKTSEICFIKTSN